jgi:16S rRNA C1402 N4-methylase RsmH
VNRLRELSKDEITGMLIENSDEPHAIKIAEAIIAAYTQGHMIDTIKELYQAISNALSFYIKIIEMMKLIEQSKVKINGKIAYLEDQVQNIDTVTLWIL